MRKTLAVVVVFGVALLIASPAQAKPVKQRAANAALCYEAFATASERVKQDFTPAELAKCGAVMIRHNAWIEAKYPSQMKYGVGELSETETMTAFGDLLGRLGKAYRVTSTQIVDAYKRLRPNG